MPKDMRKGGYLPQSRRPGLRWPLRQQTWLGEGVDSPHCPSRTVVFWDMSPCTLGFWQALVLGHCYLHKRPKGLDKPLEWGGRRSQQGNPDGPRRSLGSLIPIQNDNEGNSGTQG